MTSLSGYFVLIAVDWEDKRWFGWRYLRQLLLADVSPADRAKPD